MNDTWIFVIKHALLFIAIMVTIYVIGRILAKSAMHEVDNYVTNKFHKSLTNKKTKNGKENEQKQFQGQGNGQCPENV